MTEEQKSLMVKSIELIDKRFRIDSVKSYLSDTINLDAVLLQDELRDFIKSCIKIHYIDILIDKDFRIAMGQTIIDDLIKEIYYDSLVD